MTADDFGEAMALVSIAVVEALSEGQEQASERLESVANRLLDTLREIDAVNVLADSWTGEAVRAVAEVLIKSEIS